MASEYEWKLYKPGKCHAFIFLELHQSYISFLGETWHIPLYKWLQKYSARSLFFYRNIHTDPPNQHTFSLQLLTKMLFTLGLLLLLPPLPSLQSPTTERRNLTGSDGTKANTMLTLSRPKTTVALPKQTARPTIKANTINVTVAPTSVTTKSKAGPPTIQTTPSAVVKSTLASGNISNKAKPTVFVNQTFSTKPPAIGDVKPSKDKLVPTGQPNVLTPSAKSASASSSKINRDSTQPTVNQTVSVKSLSTTDGKTAKDKSTATAVQNVQPLTAKTVAASGVKTVKAKPSASVNQTTGAKTIPTRVPNNMKIAKEKPVATAAQTVQPTLVKDTGSAAPASEKYKGTSSSTNLSPSNKPSASTKDNPGPKQPIKVVISDGCESSKNKEQELQLKPGAPLVMTHKISLVPGGCTGECSSEMTALKERMARLEREMSSLKENCMIFII